MVEIVEYISYSILIYFLLLSIWYTILLVASFAEILDTFKEIEYGNIIPLINHGHILPISIIIPCFNEKKRIMNCLQSLLNSEYKNINVIVSNDGSTDDTMDFLINKFSLYEVPHDIKQKIKTTKIKKYYQSSIYSNLIVIDKEHSNVGDTLNAGLNACRTPLFTTVDADTILEPEALSRILFAFLSHANCVAIGGCVYVSNENKIIDGKLVDAIIPKHFVPAVQSMEYIRSFLFGRIGWSVFGGALSYAGAFTFFDTHSVIFAGGFDKENYAQDAEIILKLHYSQRIQKRPYSIIYTPNAIAWTEVPANMKFFWIQREHWQRGLICSFLTYKKMFFNVRFGVIGLIKYPLFIFFELIGPVIEACAYIVFVILLFISVIPPLPLVWALLLAAFYTAILSISTILLNILTYNKYHHFFDILRCFYLTGIEMFGFRQYRAFATLWGSLKYLFNRFRGRKL